MEKQVTLMCLVGNLLNYYLSFISP